MPAHVTALSTAPVKGLRLLSRTDLSLEASGVRENRRFYVIDERSRMVNGKQLGELSTVVADYDDRARTLTLTFADWTDIAGTLALGEPIETSFFSRTAPARPVLGPWSEALSAAVGQPVLLVEAVDAAGAVDRGPQGAVTLISAASLRALARVGDGASLDPRRFRMLVEIDGVGEHEEDGWVGRRVRIGEAEVLFHGNVGRCLVTSRDPESGEIDVPTLDMLGSYRRNLDTTEPLPFGIYGEVVRPGVVRVGDSIVRL